MPTYAGLPLPKTTLAGISQELKEKSLNFVFLLPVFFVFAIFVFCETRFFRNLGSFAKLRNSRNLCLNFREKPKSFRSQFREIFAKRNFVKNPAIMRQCVTFRGYPKNSHPHLELYSKSETAEVPTQN